ncbi:WD40 repeat protein [Giardia duodenalis]|uniref:WD40 repeat protein n=1 Tax=Giardia intestinalis (strain ATCC 50803 / WB clone C6) TaxID=184922 RepID=A8BTE2_GIAIC|nr:WD40 repeat protein [Giardia intestinalis]KAE8302855.1 WD40 repeat protein [Giardia intestinalis]|eukprot:XP_001704971.1 WD-40 repeat protein family [Giardia lamblia ATCC 50803]
MLNIGGVFTCLSADAGNEFLAAGRSNGYSVFSLNPLQEICRRTLPSENGVRLLAIAPSLPIIAMVGGSSKVLSAQLKSACNSAESVKIRGMEHADTPELMAPNEVFILNDSSGEMLNRLKYGSCVSNISIHKSFLFVQAGTKLFIHRLSSLELIHTLTLACTRLESSGASAVSVAVPSDDCIIIATPSSVVGSVDIYRLTQEENASEFKRKTVTISAHKTEVACFALSPDGIYLASVSSHGTKIRLYRTINGAEAGSLRRGISSAVVVSLAFDASSTRLASSSCNGTVHVFDVVACRGPSDDKHKEVRSFNTYRFAEKALKERAGLIMTSSSFWVLLESGEIHNVGFSSTANCILQSVWSLK